MRMPQLHHSKIKQLVKEGDTASFTYVKKSTGEIILVESAICTSRKDGRIATFMLQNGESRAFRYILMLTLNDFKIWV